MIKTIRWISVLGIALGSVACEEQAKKETAQPAAEAVKPAAKPEVAKASLKQEVVPAQDTAWQLTDARRAAIEAAVVDAKGFMDAQQQLINANPADSAAALKALDGVAKDKWVLLIGVVSQVKDTGLDLAVSYAPQTTAAAAAPAVAQPAAAQPAAAQPAAAPASAQPAAGQSATFSVTKIDGYKKESYKVDQQVVILAKYSGAGQAQAGYDVVAMGKWQLPAEAQAANPSAAAAQGGVISGSAAAAAPKTGSVAQPAAAQPAAARPAAAQQPSTPQNPATGQAK